MYVCIYEHTHSIVETEALQFGLKFVTGRNNLNLVNLINLKYKLYRIYTPIFLKWPWYHLFPKQRWKTWQGWPIYTLVFQELTLSHFDFQRQHSLSLFISTSRDSTLSLFISTSRNSLTLPVSKTQLDTRNMGVYTFCDLFSFQFCLFG